MTALCQGFWKGNPTSRRETKRIKADSWANKNPQRCHQKGLSALPRGSTGGGKRFRDRGVKEREKKLGNDQRVMGNRVPQRRSAGALGCKKRRHLWTGCGKDAVVLRKATKGFTASPRLPSGAHPRCRGGEKESFEGATGADKDVTRLVG